MTESTCATCKWWSVDEIGTGWCCNSSSPYCAEPTSEDQKCHEHTPKEQRDEWPDFNPFEIVRQALNSEYRHMLPEGHEVYSVAEYDPIKHPAPNLWKEKCENPTARYLVILISDHASIPALGVTVNDALKAAILKVEQREGSPQ